MNQDIIEMLFNEWYENNGQSKEADEALKSIYNYCQNHQIPWNDLENMIIEYAAALQYQAFCDGFQKGYQSLKR